VRLLPRRRRNPLAADTPSEPGRCTAVTNKETRCKFPAEPGSDQCVLHRRKPVPTTQAAV
jgi:hypothetical protein